PLAAAGAGRMEAPCAGRMGSGQRGAGGYGAPAGRGGTEPPRGEWEPARAGRKGKERRMALWQLVAGGERRLARGPAGEGPQELLAASLTIDALLGGAPGALAAVLRGPAAGP